MENNKIKTFLTSKGIDLSLPFQIDRDNLVTLKAKDIYTGTDFEYAYIRQSIKGAKDRLFIRNSIIENTSIQTLNVSGKAVFHNCIFHNVKIATCSLKNSCFFNCQFEDCIMIGNCFKSSYFINCLDFETIDLSDNQLDGCNLIGISLSEDVLKENNNSVIDLIIEADKFQYDVIEKEGEAMTKRIIEDETFKDKFFGKQDLRNCLYHKCSFIDCNFDNDINLDYSVDFKECLFNGTSIQCHDINKTSFDNCVFEKMSFAGNYIHVSFAGSSFKNVIIGENATFIACLFDHTNANEYFDITKNHMINIMLEKEMKEEIDSDIKNALLHLYAVMKEEDESLTEEKSINLDSLMEYVVQLSDEEYISFITSTGMKRKEQDEYI